MLYYLDIVLMIVFRRNFNISYSLREQMENQWADVKRFKNESRLLYSLYLEDYEFLYLIAILILFEKL